MDEGRGIEVIGELTLGSDERGAHSQTQESVIALTSREAIPHVDELKETDNTPIQEQPALKMLDDLTMLAGSLKSRIEEIDAEKDHLKTQSQDRRAKIDKLTRELHKCQADNDKSNQELRKCQDETRTGRNMISSLQQEMLIIKSARVEESRNKYTRI